MCGIPPSRLFKATHLPLTREALGAFGSSKNIDLTVMPAATPCVPLQRGRSLIGCAANSSRNIDLPNSLPQPKPPVPERLSGYESGIQYAMSLRGHLWPWQSASLKPCVIYQIPIYSKYLGERIATSGLRPPRNQHVLTHHYKRKCAII